MATASTSKSLGAMQVTQTAQKGTATGRGGAGGPVLREHPSRAQRPSPPPQPELGWTPLHLAAYNNRPDDVAVLLKDPKTQVNARAEAPIPSASGKNEVAKGLTPLHLAAGAGATEALKALLGHRAPAEGTHAQALDVNAKSGNGMTPLHLAAVAGKPGAVRALLRDSRADPTFVDSEGNTPLLYAAKAPGPITEMLLADPRVTANVVNARNRHGFGAVHVAAEAANLGNPGPLQALTRCPTTDMRLESRGPTKYTPQDILQRAATLQEGPPSGSVPPAVPQPSSPPQGPASHIHILVVHPIISIILIVAVSGFSEALSSRLFWALLLMISLDICWIAAQVPTMEELQRRAAVVGFPDRVWGVVHSGTPCLLVRAGVGILVVTLAWLEAPVGSPMWAAVTMTATFALAIDIPLLLELHERSLRYGNLLDAVLPRDVQNLVWGPTPQPPAEAAAPTGGDAALPLGPKDTPEEAGPGGTGGTAVPAAPSGSEVAPASPLQGQGVAEPPEGAGRRAPPAAALAEQPPSWQEKLLDALVPSEELRVALDFMLCQLVALLFTGDIFMLGFSLQAIFLGAISSGAVWLALYRRVFPPCDGGPPPGPAPPPGGGSRRRAGIAIAWKDREFWAETFQCKTSLLGWRDVAAVSVQLTRPLGYSCVIYLTFSLLMSGACPSQIAWWAQPLFFVIVALDVCLNLMAVHQQKCSGTPELRVAIFATRTFAAATMSAITILLVVFQGLGWLWDLSRLPPCPPHLLCTNGCIHMAGLLIVFFTISLVQSALLWGPLRLLGLGWGVVVASVSFLAGFFVGSLLWAVCVIVKAVALPFQKGQPPAAAPAPVGDTNV